MKLLSISAETVRTMCGAIVTIGLASTSQAAILVTNLGEPRRDASTIQENPTIEVPSPWGAQSFSTDANVYRLDTIETLLGDLTEDPTIVAELRADTDGTVPGTLITTFSLTGITAGAPASTVLTPVGTVNLAANTIYWIVLGALGNGSYTWEFAEGNNQTGPGGFGNYAYSDDQGAVWVNFGADNPYKITINVAPIPVPAMTVLFGLGVAGLLSRRRRPLSSLL